MEYLGRRLGMVVAVGLAVLLAGCVSVRSAVAPNANLGALRTFAFVAPDNARAPVDPRSRGATLLGDSPAGQQIQRQLWENLTAKGYAAAPQGVQPDFLVAYRTVYRERTDVTGWGGPWAFGGGWGWGWGWGGPWGADVNTYTEGTIVVDFVDPASNRVLWRGTATSVVDHPDNPKLGHIAKAVDKLMKDYPTTALASSGSRATM